ncbi:MAG: DUF1501 domain-containing protein [Verrucomicrobiales bacterium]|nr:DUF1501 domain-containing protein [Verrucomicrobiales bacterium]
MKKNRSKKLSLTTRREFLSTGGAGIGLMAMGAFAPSFLVDTVNAAGAAALDKDGKILVLIKLGGGNDGMNMLVPTHDDQYYKNRPKIGIAKKDALMIDENFGFNPRAPGYEELYKEGHMSVMLDVGYPNSTRSHFSGQDFYERGGGLEFSGTGWLGRYLDSECPQDQVRKINYPVATHISRNLPITLRSKSPQPVFSMLSSDIKTQAARTLDSNDDTSKLLKTAIQAAEKEENPKVNYLNMAYMNALITEEKVRDTIASYKADSPYPDHRIARDLKAVAALVASGMGTRVYSLDIGGFDTHGQQLGRHGDLHEELSSSILAFTKDLAAKKLSDKVIVMPYSEFGRRPYENGSAGTDHGTMSTFYAVGTGLNAGIFGTHPVIPSDNRSDSSWSDDTSIDFRQLYATVLDRWLDTDSKLVLNKEYKHIDFLLDTKKKSRSFLK